MNTGLDPEILVISQGKIVPASYFLPPPTGTPQGRLNHLSFDNAAVEMRPSHSRKRSRVTTRLSTILRTAVKEMALARAKGVIPEDAHFNPTPAGRLSVVDRGLESVQEFGCSPSCVVDENYARRNVKPCCCADETLVRSAGFHIHQELRHPGTTQAAVAVLDGLLGLADVSVNCKLAFKEASNARRQELGYGRAGEFRSRRGKDLTILEYRVMSPWPLMAPLFVDWCTRIMKSVALQDADTLVNLLNDYPDRKDIMDAINTCNDTKASLLRKQCIGAYYRGIGGRAAFKLPLGIPSLGRAIVNASRNGILSEWL